MPRVRVPVRRSGIRYAARPGRRYPVRPIAPPPGRSGLAGLLGGLAGLLLCLLCLAAAGLLGLFAAFIAATAYLGRIYRDLRSSGPGLDINMIVLLAALCFAGFYKLRRSL